ncbi:hypothetical protein HMPREF0819_1667, partial [Streptococcus equinus ATCC 9812]
HLIYISFSNVKFRLYLSCYVNLKICLNSKKESFLLSFLL